MAGAFQSSAFQTSAFQTDDEGGWHGPGGDRHDDVLHQAYARTLPQPVARAIERTARDANAAEARDVLEAQIDRAGAAWDERMYALLLAMRQRDMDTVRELIAWQERMEMDDEDAIAVVMMLH